jgi:chaperonin GroES
MNVKVIGKKVLAREVTEQQQQIEGGIIIPDSANETPRECIVESVGDVEDGLIEIGCTLLISKGAGVGVNIDTKDFIIVDECDIIAVIN